MPTLAEIVDQVHGWYPPSSAESWDAVGLTLGDPEQQVSKVLCAVDPTAAVAAEAVEFGAGLLLTHHPLFLTPVHGFAATDPKGKVAHTLSRANCALLTAHTNADQASDGVSEALAKALGMTDLKPLVAAPSAPRDKLTVFVPEEAASIVRAALTEAGAGTIGAYDAASFTSTGEGRFRPLAGANPMIGEVGTHEVVPEVRIEVILDRHLRSHVVKAMISQHPYEEPAYDLTAVADAGNGVTGHGRVGLVEPTTLAEFAEVVNAALPSTHHGVRIAGDPARRIRTVALCGGAGDGFLDAAAASGADVYLTSDLRHHRASEFLESSEMALIDTAHWAAEWTWLPVLEQRLTEVFGKQLTTRVSDVVTDPWTMRL